MCITLAVIFILVLIVFLTFFLHSLVFAKDKTEMEDGGGSSD